MWCKNKRNTFHIARAPCTECVDPDWLRRDYVTRVTAGFLNVLFTTPCQSASPILFRFLCDSLRTYRVDVINSVHLTMKYLCI